MLLLSVDLWGCFSSGWCLNAVFCGGEWWVYGGVTGLDMGFGWLSFGGGVDGCCGFCELVVLGWGLYGIDGWGWVSAAVFWF